MRPTKRQPAFTLIELLAVAVVLGLVAAIVLPRFSGAQDEARRNACFVNQGDLENEVQRWWRIKGSPPMSDLSDLAGDSDYLPSGLPTCPVDGTPYRIDRATGEVIGHTH